MASISHLKRSNMPTFWPVKKKNIKFVVKPKPGSHKIDYVIPILIILREKLSYAATSKEAKQILYNEEVLVNGKRVKDIKFPVGLFDIIEIKKTNERYLVLYDNVGKVKLSPTKADFLYLKIVGKKLLKGGIFQLNFMNGFNLVVDKKTYDKAKVADTLVYDFIKKRPVSIINMKEGDFVYVFDGKFKGKIGQIKSFIDYNGVSRNILVLDLENKEQSTAKDYCLVIGTKKTDIKEFE